MKNILYFFYSKIITYSIFVYYKLKMIGYFFYKDIKFKLFNKNNGKIF